MPLRGHYEECRWEARPGAMGGRRDRQAFSYKAFVPDPIADWDVSLRSESIMAISEATAALAELNHSQAQLDPLEGLASQLLRSESLASSRIEGLELSHQRLARASYRGEQAHDPRAAEVLGNVKAMERAIEIATEASPFAEGDLKQIHKTLLRFTLEQAIAGKVRDKQNWIGRSRTPRDADYVPPPPGHVKPLLRDLCEFMNRDDLAPVLQAAIAHAQFETIHPFGDGNGRVGRCLIHAVLIRRGLAPRYVPPISLILAAHARAYVGGLIDFREGRVDDWVELFAYAATTAAREAEHLAQRFDRLRSEWIERLDRPRQDSSAYVVLDALPAHPVIDVPIAQRIGDISDVTAGRVLNRLDEAGILTRVDDRHRGRVWEARELFDLVSEFEAELQVPD